MKKKKNKTLIRSSVTGRFVTKNQAKCNPRETVVEKRK